MSGKQNHTYNNHPIDYRKLWGSHESNSDDHAVNGRNPWRDTVVANLDVESGSSETMQMDSFQMVFTWQLGDTAPVCGIAPEYDSTAGNSDVEHTSHKIKLREHHNADLQSGKYDRTQAVVLPESSGFIY